MQVGVSVSIISIVGFLVEMGGGRFVVLFGGLVPHHCCLQTQGDAAERSNVEVVTSVVIFKLVSIVFIL